MKKLFIILFLVFIISCENAKDNCSINEPIASDFTNAYLVSCEENSEIKYGLINEKGEYLVRPQYSNIELTEFEGHFYYIYRETIKGAETLVNLSTHEVLASGEQISPTMYQQTFLVQSDDTTTIYDGEQDTKTNVDFENIRYHKGELIGYMDEKWYSDSLKGNAP